MSTKIKAEGTKNVLSPAQADRLKKRAKAHFTKNPKEENIIMTVDGQIFKGTDEGAHAAYNHAVKLNSKFLIEITPADVDSIEGGTNAELTESGQPNPTQAKRMNERAGGYFKNNKDAKSILVTVDGNLFVDTEEGEHAARNHGAKLTNKNVFKATPGGEITADKGELAVKNGPDTSAKAKTEAALYVEELVKENELDAAKEEAAKLSKEELESLNQEVKDALK